MDDLSTWLLAQVTEDEKLAEAATPGPWQWDVDGVDQVALSPDYIARYRWVSWVDGDTEDILAVNGEHIATWDPARVLAECEAKRQIVEWCIEVIGDRDLSGYGKFGALKADPAALAATLAVETLRTYGALYAKLGRPGYQESWRPA